jgi:hypothetical protein
MMVQTTPMAQTALVKPTLMVMAAPMASSARKEIDPRAVLAVKART